MQTPEIINPIDIKEESDPKKQNFDTINQQIKDFKTNPENFKKPSKEELKSLGEYLTNNKNLAPEFLYNTLNAIKSNNKLKRGDRKALEAIRDMIIKDKYATMDDVCTYHLKIIFDEAGAVKKY